MKPGDVYPYSGKKEIVAGFGIWAARKRRLDTHSYDRRQRKF